MTFEKWLIQYKNLDAPLGDLAKDFLDARKLPDEKCDVMHLRKWRACREAYDTLREAQRTYIAYCKRKGIEPSIQKPPRKKRD